MENQNQRDDALFEELGKNRKKRKHRLLRTLLIIFVVAAVVLVGAVTILRGYVQNRFGNAGDDILTYAAATGTIHTLVSGDGTLEEVDLETISVPEGVEIREVEVKRNQTVAEGDILATVEMSTVMQALADTQAAIDELDKQISDAEGDKVGSQIKAGVSGRVKILHAINGSDVTACMAENGALAVLSLDGWMAVEIETEALCEEDTVRIRLADGAEEEGTVDSVVGGVATVLVTDNGPEYDEEVTILTGDGQEVGSGRLYIHRPLRITGYAGTISRISVKLNQKVNANTTVFTLTNTSFSTNYEKLLRDRQEQEEILMDLLTIYQDGAVLAPYEGLVSSVIYGEEEDDSASAAAATSSYSMGLFGMYTTPSASAATTAAATEESSGSGTDLLTLTPNEKVQVTIGIGESDILSLEEGQEAEITVASVSEDDVITGIVTEVSRTADSSSGYTQYSATVELEKAAGMLAGMSAEVGIRIQGVENAILVPVDAVHQTSTISYVYTGYDAETEEYTGMVEVETGLWGDNYVEIISGLKVGDTVYYREKQNFFFNFANMGNMGTPPRSRG